MNVNLERITACGECCDACEKKRGGLCAGCIESDGRVPEWAESGRCPVHACSRAHGVRFCGLCAAFPCPQLPELIFWNPDVVEHMRALARQWARSGGEGRGSIGYDG